jgi:hypothetical protein
MLSRRVKSSKVLSEPPRQHLEYQQLVSRSMMTSFCPIKRSRFFLPTFTRYSSRRRSPSLKNLGDRRQLRKQPKENKIPRNPLERMVSHKTQQLQIKRQPTRPRS